MAARPSSSGPRASSKGALIEAALDEFSEKGYEAATVAGIAERAGVTTGALYAHFDGKLDLLVETIGLANVGEFWRELTSVAGLPRHEAAAALSRGLASRTDRRALLLLDMIVVARRHPEVASVLHRGLRSYLAAMAEAAETGTAARMIEPALDPGDLARLAAALAFGLLVLGSLDESPPTDRALVWITEALLSTGDVPVDAPGGSDQPAELAQVTSRASAAARSRQQLHDAIVNAAAEGHSLRRIGAAAGVSHERVRRILSDG